MDDLAQQKSVTLWHENTFGEQVQPKRCILFCNCGGVPKNYKIWPALPRQPNPFPVPSPHSITGTPLPPPSSSLCPPPPSPVGSGCSNSRPARNMRCIMQNAQQTNARRIYFPAAPASLQPASARPDAWRALDAHAMPSRHELGQKRQSHVPSRFNAAAATACPSAAARR